MSLDNWVIRKPAPPKAVKEEAPSAFKTPVKSTSRRPKSRKRKAAETVVASQAPPDTPADSDPELSEYEKQRLEHIRRNQEYMARLGIFTLVESEKKDQEAKKPRKKRAKREPTLPTRRSTRLKGAKPEYTGETIDRFGEELDRAASRRKRSPDARPLRLTTAEALENSTRWLEASRKALLAVGGAAGVAPNSRDEWHAEAVRRWGDKVNPGEEPDWELFVQSRLPTPPPPSAHDLLQEYYAHDMYQLLVSCVLMSRVSSRKIKHDTVAAFFAAYPTPSSFLDSEAADVLKILKPLGLFPYRMKSLVAITQRFLEMPKFDVGLDKSVKIYGIGAFGCDSFEIFCRNNMNAKPGDRNLAAFVAWQKRHAKKMKDQESKKGTVKEEPDEP